MAFIGTEQQPTITRASAVSGSDWHQQVAAAGTAKLILSASETRQFASVFNHSNASLYLMMTSDNTPTVNFFDVKLSSGSYYELPNPVWRGPVYGIWDAANGWAMVRDISGSVQYVY